MFHIKIYVVKAITYTNIMYCLWGFGADFMLRSPTSQEKQKFTVVALFSKNHCNTLYNNESVNVAAFTMSDYNVQTKSFWALKQILDQVRHGLHLSRLLGDSWSQPACNFSTFHLSTAETYSVAFPLCKDSDSHGWEDTFSLSWFSSGVILFIHSSDWRCQLTFALPVHVMDFLKE